MAFLLLAAVLSSVGIGVVLFRHRRPVSMWKGMEEFSAALRALSPEPGDDERRARRR